MRSMREHQPFDADGRGDDDDLSPSATPSIGTVLDDLERSLERLEKSVAVMGERLTPITREQPPAPVDPDEGMKLADSDFDDSSPIRRQLKVYARKIDRLSRSLEGLSGGVDI